MSLNTPITKPFPKVEKGTTKLRQVWPSPHPTRPEAITLFSGVGASSLALRRAGYRVTAHDFMREACTSLHENGFDVVQGDIRDVDFLAPYYSRVRVIAGGPPCQPFSQNGRNAGDSDERDMIPEFLRAVAQILPEQFILENVRGLAGPRHRAYLDRRVSEFEALGYRVEWRVLNAADHGVAQDRKRLFVVGLRADIEGPIRWPAKQQRATMAGFLGWGPSTAKQRNQMAPAPAQRPLPDGRPAYLWPYERPSTTVVGSFRPEIQAAPGYRKAGDGPRQNAPGSVYVTPEERLTLQGLPASWKVVGSNTAVGLQIGNSCPVPLIAGLIQR